MTDIDTEVTPTQRTSILAQIAAARSPDASTTLHPSIPSSSPPSFSPLIEAELERVAQKAPLNGIDLTPYESSALEAPTNTSPHSDEKDPELLAQWRTTLQRAYGLNTYLQGRYTNLSLLETYGKNAWLISNAQLEEELKSLTRELEVLKNEAENVEEGRRRRQEGVRAEMEGLDASWKNGVEKIVEVELAVEGLRREVLERKRAGAGG